ncbi:MAG: hypothetical protein J6Y25_04550 [Elusimicrobiaceae bacterium]|nr:hypothetical protein [Elusimicrobiaceae bacterium]
MKIHALFGGEAVVIYDRVTRRVKALMTVLGAGGIEESAESVDLTGGNYDGPVKSEKGQTTYDFSVTAKELSDGMFETVKGAKVTANAADASGYVGTVTNITGTLATSLTPTVITAKKDNLPFGKVALEITSTGKAKAFVLGSLKQGQSGWKSADGAVTDEVTITAGGTLQLEDLGIQIAVASGATLTVGDRVEFDVRPANTAGSVNVVVSSRSESKEFGVMVIYPRQSDGSMHILDLPRVRFNSALSLSIMEREFGEHELTGKPMVDELTGTVYTYSRINAAA